MSAPWPGYGKPASDPSSNWAGWVGAYVATELALAVLVYLVSSPVRMLLLQWAVYFGYFVLLATWVVAWGCAALAGKARLSMGGIARWLAAPLVAALCLGLTLGEVWSQARFELSRPALERVAARAQSGEHIQPGFVGLTPVDEVMPEADGTTFFFVSDAVTFRDICGLAFNPVRTPDPEFGYALSDGTLADGWWTFCS